MILINTIKMNKMEVSKSNVKCKTIFIKDAITMELADSLYLFLKHNIVWEDGVKSKQGFTRKAKALNFGDIPEIDDVIITVLNKITTTNYLIDGIYLNFYENETMWTPNHSHRGTHQLVISLGDSRILQVGKKDYEMTNGSSIIFGSSQHGIKKSDIPKNGRISLATFLTPIEVK